MLHAGCTVDLPAVLVQIPLFDCKCTCCSWNATWPLARRTLQIESRGCAFYFSPRWGALTQTCHAILLFRSEPVALHLYPYTHVISGARARACTQLEDCISPRSDLMQGRIIA